jgi:hypothetical protein
MRKSLPALAALALLLPALALAGDLADRFRKSGWSETDFTRTAIALDEILSGGPPKDGIPSIDRPRFIAVAEATHLAGREPVIGLALHGDARAYPLQVLTWHEIVNDVVGGVPVAVTYCPLCNAAIVFERTVDGVVLDFGTTGLLRHSDLVMYDRQSESWWQQFTGEAIVGEMTGKALKTVPARLQSFALFKAEHPQGRVLVPENPALRDYGRNPYAGYDTAERPFLYHGDLPEGIDPMARVVVVRDAGRPRAYALERLAATGRIEDGDIVLSWSAGQASALDTRVIAEGRDIGNIVAQRQSAEGLQDLVYDVTFAFVVKAFHPDLDIFK